MTLLFTDKINYIHCPMFSFYMLYSSMVPPHLTRGHPLYTTTLYLLKSWPCKRDYMYYINYAQFVKFIIIIFTRNILILTKPISMFINERTQRPLKCSSKTTTQVNQ